MGGAGVAAAVLLLCVLYNTATSQIGRLSRSVLSYRESTLSLSPPSAFLVEPSDILTAPNSSALFNCSFSSSNPASLSWLKDEAALTPGNRFSYLANGSLLIQPTQEEDQGEYSCRVTDLITQDSGERSATLTLACEQGTVFRTFLPGPV